MATPTQVTDIKFSPKLVALCKWKYIDEVNKKLDSGETAYAVANFINQKGFKISMPLVYEYSKMRKKALVDGANVEHMIGLAHQPMRVVNKKDPQTAHTQEKLKSEIDALDKLIQGGYNTLLEWEGRPIAPKTMMDAIRLKNELTDGNHGFLTNYGIEQLRAIEQNKYQILMEYLMTFVPAKKKDAVLKHLDELEEEYYMSTPYYEEWLRAHDNLTEDEIKVKLDAYDRLQKQKEEQENPTTAE